MQKIWYALVVLLFFLIIDTRLMLLEAKRKEQDWATSHEISKIRRTVNWLEVDSINRKTAVDSLFDCVLEINKKLEKQ